MWAGLPGGEVRWGIKNHYDIILLNKSGLSVTDPNALISSRNFFDKTIQTVKLQNRWIIDLNKELKKGNHYFELPSLFGKTVLYERKEYVHSSPAFKVSYPKHYKVVEPELNEVFRARHPAGFLILSVTIDSKGHDIPLKDIDNKKIYAFTECLNYGNSIYLSGF